IPNIDSLLIPEPKLEPMNQVNENVAMTLGRPVAAFPDQDHLAHIQVLVDFMVRPIFGKNSLIMPTFLPVALDHLKEHILYWYVNVFYEGLKRGVADLISVPEGEDVVAVVMREKDPETRQELERLLAQMSPKVTNEMAPKTFEKLLPIIHQAQELAAQIQPPMAMPSDPNKMAAVEAKKQGDQLRAQIEREK